MLFVVFLAFHFDLRLTVSNKSSQLGKKDALDSESAKNVLSQCDNVKDGALVVNTETKTPFAKITNLDQGFITTHFETITRIKTEYSCLNFI